MKALTLHQPWASLVAIGAKRIETRSWCTNYRGPLAIHAGKSTEHIHVVLHDDDFTNALGAAGILNHPNPTFGAVVAVCRLADCLPTKAVGCFPGVFEDYPELDTAMERTFGDYTPGRWAWVLDCVEPLEKPIPARGAQGLWNWEFPNPDPNGGTA